MADLLILGGTIVTMDARRRIIKDGAVAIEGGRIVGVGKEEDFRRDFSADKTIDAAGHAVLPGLINTHIHTPMTIQRGLGESIPLVDRLSRVILPIDGALTAEETHFSSLLGGMELIKAGTTTCNDMPSGLHPEEAIKALGEVGMRAEIGRGLSDINQVGPKELNVGPKEIRGQMERLIGKWHGSFGGRIRYRLSMQFVPACSDELLLLCKELAEKYDLGLHIHANQDADLLNAAKKRTGMSEIEYLHKLGLTGPKAVFAHCVFVTPKELEILSSTSTNVAYSPVIPAKTGAGIAPVSWLVRNGVNVSLGTDSAGLNTNQDMFEEMRTAGVLQRGSNHDPTALPTEKLMEMATVDGARALSLNDVGSLETGKRADLILVDLKRPHLVPLQHRLVSHLVWSAYAEDVRTVIVDGKVVMEDRRLLTVDERAVMEKAESVANDVLDRVGYKEGEKWPWS